MCFLGINAKTVTSDLLVGRYYLYHACWCFQQKIVTFSGSLLEIPGKLMAITVHHAGVFLLVPIKAKAPLLIGHYIHHDACWYFNQKLPPKGVYLPSFNMDIHHITSCDRASRETTRVCTQIGSMHHGRPGLPLIEEL